MKDWQQGEVMLWKVCRSNTRYEVSHTGLVRRVDGKMVGQWLNDQGYAMVRLSQPRRMHRVHRLIAEAFVPNPRNMPAVNHLNNNRSDNRAENLEWCSQLENLTHARNQGRMPDNYWKGKRSPNARLSDSEVFEIRQIYAMGQASLADLGLRFCISKRSIGRIVNGDTYV